MVVVIMCKIFNLCAYIHPKGNITGLPQTFINVDDGASDKDDYNYNDE